MFMEKYKVKLLITLMTIAVIGLVVVQVFWSVKTISTEEIRFDAKVNAAMISVVSKLDKHKTADIIVEKVIGDEPKMVWMTSDTSEHGEDNVIFLSSEYESSEKGKDEKLEIQVEVSTESSGFVYNAITKDSSNKRTIRKIYKYNNGSEVFLTNSDVDTVVVNRKQLISEVIEEMRGVNDEEYLIKNFTASFLDSVILEELGNKGIITDYEFGILNQSEDVFLVLSSKEDSISLERTKYNVALFPNDVFTSPLKLLIHLPNKFTYLLRSVWVMLSLSLLFVGIIILVYLKTLKMFLDQKKITEVKNDLINNITHEFKTPISSISLASEALQNPQLIDKENSLKKYSGIIAEENTRLTKLVENLLNTAAFERSEIDLKKETINVANVIQAIVDVTLERVSNTSIIINDNSDGKSTIEADLFHFSNIINNLIDNAIKYSKGDKKILIELYKTSTYVRINIKDNGMGITKSNHQKIFETFYRVPTGNIHNVKGNGIGLSYVKKIVEAHGGSIKIKSKLGKGSTFTVVFPNE